MRSSRMSFPMCATLFLLAAGTVMAGEAVDVNSLKYGMRYCPAPWCDNQEFIDTHFGIDADTGKLTKYVGGEHPYASEISDSGEEVVLYTSPPISVENRYVPPSGAALAMRPPPTKTQALRSRATSAVRPAPRPVETRAAPQYNAGNGNQAYSQKSRPPQAKVAPKSANVQKTERTGKQPWWKFFSRR